MRVAEISSRRPPLAIARCGYSDWRPALELLQFFHLSARVHFSARFSASHYNLQGRREIFVGLYWRPLPGLANWKWNFSLIESTGQLHRYHLSGFVLLQPRVVLTPCSLTVISDEGTNLINVSLWLVLRLIMSGNPMASRTVSSKFNASFASWMTKAWLTMVPFRVRPPEKVQVLAHSLRNSHFPHPFAFTLICYAYI